MPNVCFVNVSMLKNIIYTPHSNPQEKEVGVEGNVKS